MRVSTTLVPVGATALIRRVVLAGPAATTRLHAALAAPNRDRARRMSTTLSPEGEAQLLDPDSTLQEIRRLARKFRDGRIGWDDASRLGELVEQLDRMATTGVLPRQWQGLRADTSTTDVA